LNEGAVLNEAGQGLKALIDFMVPGELRST